METLLTTSAPATRPAVLAAGDLATAFAGCPDALALLHARPGLLHLVRTEPQVLPEVVQLLTTQLEQRRRKDHYQAELVRAVTQLLPAAFVASLPPVVQGCTPEQPGYWLEPDVQPVRPDSARFVFETPYADPDHWCANDMAPRFLNGVAYVVEQVLPGEELIIGNVYRLQYTGGHGGGATFRLLGLEPSPITPGGQRMVVQYDADTCPEGEFDCWGLRFEDPDFRLYRFLHYHSFAGLVLPTRAFPVRPWAELQARGAAWRAAREQQRTKRNARRRELYAQRKAQAPAPAVEAAPPALPPVSFAARPAVRPTGRSLAAAA